MICTLVMSLACKLQPIDRVRMLLLLCFFLHTHLEV